MTVSDSIPGTDSSDPVDQPKPSNMKLQTIGEVKKAVRKLVKNLILICQNMGDIPPQRYAMMKLIYTEDTPKDYEPPYFVPFPKESKDWYFGTHNVEEQPDRFSVGSLETGIHTMSIKVTSVAELLPPGAQYSQEDQSAFGQASVNSSLLGKRRRELEDVKQREDAGDVKSCGRQSMMLKTVMILNPSKRQ